MTDSAMSSLLPRPAGHGADLPPAPGPVGEPIGAGAGYATLIGEVLGSSALFAAFSADEVRTFCGFLQVYRAAPGTAFIREGDPGDFMVLLLEGEVEVFKSTRAGGRSLVGVVAPGRTLGEMSLIDGEPRFATCVAATQITFAALHRAGFEHVMREHPLLGEKILLHLARLLNQRLRQVSAQLMQVMQQAT